MSWNGVKNGISSQVHTSIMPFGSSAKCVMGTRLSSCAYSARGSVFPSYYKKCTSRKSFACQQSVLSCLWSSRDIWLTWMINNKCQYSAHGFFLQPLFEWSMWNFIKQYSYKKVHMKWLIWGVVLMDGADNSNTAKLTLNSFIYFEIARGHLGVRGAASLPNYVMTLCLFTGSC